MSPEFKHRTKFALETLWVEFVSRWIWAWFRLLVKSQLTRRCKRCILNEKASPLDKNGLCRECKIFFSEKKSKDEPPKTDPIKELLASMPPEPSRLFDVLVLFSGGKDSTYLLHRIKSEHPHLRILSVLVDNGFMSPFALDNARRVIEHMKVSHLTLQIPKTLVKKTFRYTLTHLEKQTGYSLVDQMDGHMTFDAAKKLATDLRIPAILCGLSKTQILNIFGDIGWEFSRLEMIEKPVQRAGIPLSDFPYDPEEQQFWFDGSRYPESIIPRFLFPFYIWNPTEDFIVREVKNLQILKKTHPLLTNNALIPVIGLAEVARFGFSSFEIEFARMVRVGKTKRTQWLHLFEMLEFSARTGLFINKTAQETLTMLNLKKADLGIHE